MPVSLRGDFLSVNCGREQVRGASAALLVLDKRNDPLRARVPQNAVQRVENLA
jgi:hypothetical protein